MAAGIDDGLLNTSEEVVDTQPAAETTPEESTQETSETTESAKAELQKEATPEEKAKFVPADDLNKMKAAFQRRESQAKAELDEIRRQYAETQETLWNIQKQALPPEQQVQADLERAYAQREQALREQQTFQQRQQQALEPVFKEIVIRDMLDQAKAAKLNIAREDFEEFESPKDMQAFLAREMRVAKAAKAKEAATKHNIAAAGGPGNTRKEWLKMDTRQLLGEAFS